MTTRRATALGAFGLYALSAQAQDTAESGLRMTLDVNQQLSVDSNAGLTAGGESSTSAATTGLTFNLISQTPIDTLNLRVGGVLRVLNSPNTDGTEARFNEPSVRLSFERDVGHSSASASVSYARTPIEFIRPLSNLAEDGTGEIELPDDLDDLQGDGTRISLGYALGLELGKEAPLGLSLAASENILRYSDLPAGTSLFRTKRRTLSAGVRATLSPVLNGSLNAARETYDARNTEQTDRTTDRFSAGLTYSASETLTLSGSLGYSRTETREGIGAARSTQKQDGVTAAFDANYELPNGSLGLSFNSDVDQNARRNTLELSRALELPSGALSASLGLTRGAADDTQVIGSLNWRRDLPTGNLTARLSRGVTSNNDDEERLSTSIGLGYTHQITDLSSFGLRASYSTSEDTAGGDRATRANASATYSLQVTEDWSLNSGIELRRSDNKDDGSATSRRVFIGLGRSFDLRP